MPDISALTNLVHLFQGRNTGGSSDNMKKVFHARFDNDENGATAFQEFLSFTTSPLLHGKFEGDETERPGYFPSLPYTPAFAQYFMRCALEPNHMGRNFRTLIDDINAYAQHIYDNNPRKSDLAKIIIIKPQMTVGVPYYPTRQYMEAVIAPHLKKIGVAPHIEHSVEFPAPVTL